MTNNKATYWNRIASFYNGAFERKTVYQQMYQFVSDPLCKNMKVLEIGTGTGMIARHMADKVELVEATDVSPKMIGEANRIPHPNNISFSVADVFRLSYDNDTFEAVVISNVLHIIPDPEKALEEIGRVLKTDGLLIAPTFLWKEMTFKGKIKRTFMMMTGFPIHSKWDELSFTEFLKSNNFEIERTKKLKSDFTLCCVACKKKNL